MSTKNFCFYRKKTLIQTLLNRTLSVAFSIDDLIILYNRMKTF